VKTARKGQGKAMMDIFCYKSPFKNCFSSYKDEVFQFNSMCGRCMSKHLKEHSAVVVKKDFWLRKAFNFFKNLY